MDETEIDVFAILYKLINRIFVQSPNILRMDCVPARDDAGSAAFPGSMESGTQEMQQTVEGYG